MTWRSTEPVRKLLHLEREEIDAFGRRNYHVRTVMRELAPALRARDRRGFRRWVFVLGWLACLEFYQDYFDKMASKIAGAAETAAAKELEAFYRGTKQGMLEWEQAEPEGGEDGGED